MNLIAFPAWQDRIVDDRAVIALPKELERRGVERAYIVMSQHLRADVDWFGPLQEALGSRLAGICSGLPQHSPLPDVLAAAREAKALSCDALVSIGGGSSIDAAKIIQHALTLDTFDLDDLLTSRGSRARTRQRGRVRHVCVPTTLSGAEFTYFAGGRNPATLLKEAFVAPDLLPRTVVFDQALATRTPDRLWLSSGLRAMDHAVEALLSGRNNALGHSLALDGIARLRSGLPATHAEPGNLEARRLSQFGGWFCSIGLLTGVPMGASHAIGHVIGSVFDVPHGLTSCIALPAVMEFNYRAGAPVFDDIARALGGTSGREAPDLLRRFIAALGLPTTLTDVGLDRRAFDAIAQGTMSEGWAKTNPRPLNALDDVIPILEAML